MKPKILAESAIEPVLEAFQAFFDTSDASNFSPGETVQFGWSWFMIADDNDGLKVKAPKLGEMPMEFIEDCSDSLNVVLKQRYICDSFGQNMSECNARESAIVAHDILSCKEIFINRIDEAEGHASGWYVGAQDSKADMENPEHFELKSLWELTCIFPSITEFLLLPVDWQVFFGARPVVLNDFSEVDFVRGSYFEQKYKS